MIHLEKINKSKLPIIIDLAYTIWPSTYAKILLPEQLTYMLDTFYTVENLSKQMDNGQIFELVLKEASIVGFVAYEINCKETELLKIHKIYLLPETQGKGFGKIVIENVLKTAKTNQQKGVFLNVNRYNTAQNFYQKLGFTIAKQEVINIGNGYVMDDYVMEMRF